MTETLPQSESSPKERLLAISADVFSQFGWRDSTVDHLCVRAGVPTSVFYDVYATVDDLFVEMYRRRGEELLETTRSALTPLGQDAQPPRSSDDAIEVVSSALAAMARDRTWWILTTEYMLRAVRHPDAARTYLQLRKSFRRDMIDVVDGALSSAGVPGMDTAALVDMMTSLHRGAVTQSFLDQDSPAPPDVDRLVWPAMVALFTSPQR